MTADHKVLSENCESRNNHRHEMVQVLTTQWIQSYPCITKTRKKHTETYRSSWIHIEHHCASTPDRSETNGVAKRVVRRIQRCTFAVLLQSRQILWNAVPICEMLQISYLTGTPRMRDVLGNHSQDQFDLVHKIHFPYYCEGPVKNPSIYVAALFLGYAVHAE